MFRVLIGFQAIILILVLLDESYSQSAAGEKIPKLDNPFNVTYLKEHVRKQKPRIVLNSDTENLLRAKIKADPVVRNMYQAVALNAQSVLQQPLLERTLIGRRLLSNSREFLWRMNMLGMLYRIEGDQKALDRINSELLAVCRFSDWNPSHYLDVAEMAMGVAIGLDWTAANLPDSTVSLALEALVSKAIEPSWTGETPGWVYGSNNWNQVCNGGLIAASIAVAEYSPELAAKTIHRALNGLPYSLIEYGPDGVYPEGSTYWSYGTSFSVITIAMLESAFGTDFGMSNYPAFLESAKFRVLCNAPSGWYYNFADCGDERSKIGDLTLAWFAYKTGNSNYFEKGRFMVDPVTMGKLPRLGGAALVWLSQYEEKSTLSLPDAWKGDGSNPIVIFNGGENDPHQYYFGGKGGRGIVNHGNMDGGSFIFELNGIRWVLDPGNQPYHELEKTGFDLWGRCQDCQRWSLLTKNNFGHSTLSVNNSLHQVDGMVNLVDFSSGDPPQASFDLTPTLAGLVNGATRKFIKDSPNSLLIEDAVEPNVKTELVTWQLLTQAEAAVSEGVVVLTQSSGKLIIENLSHPSLIADVVDLDPPPLKLDRQITNLKRIEFRYSKNQLKSGDGIIKIRLSGTQTD